MSTATLGWGSGQVGLTTAGSGGNRASDGAAPQIHPGHVSTAGVTVASNTRTSLAEAQSGSETRVETPDVRREALHRQRVFVPRSPLRSLPGRIAGLEKWEGHVTEVDDGVFSAELWPTDSATSGPVVAADFSNDLIAEGDRGLLVVGAIFYCTVRTVLGPGGRPSRTSSIRMRRTGIWSESALEDIRERARQRAARLAEHAR